MYYMRQRHSCQTPFHELLQGTMHDVCRWGRVVLPQGQRAVPRPMPSGKVSISLIWCIYLCLKILQCRWPAATNAADLWLGCLVDWLADTLFSMLETICLPHTAASLYRSCPTGWAPLHAVIRSPAERNLTYHKLYYTPQQLEA